LNFTIDWDGHFQGEGDVLLPFYDSRHTTIFMQIGARSMAVSGGEDDGNDRWIGNFGLGQRWFPNATEEDSGDWMLGYNAFFDNDFSRSHRRGGLGVELQYDWLHLASNYYFPLSGWKGSYDFDSRFIEERPAEGWDARVKAWLPFYRNVALTGAYTQWYGDHVGMFGHRNLEKDPRVWSYGLEYTPVPLLSGFLTQRQTERGRTETEFGLNFTAHFGMPWEDQMQHSKVAELRAVSGSRHEFVDRENRIILEYRAKNSYRIEYLGPAGPNVFRFRVLNGFDEFMAGQTVSVTANGMYLAEAAPERPATLFARAANFLDELISVKAAWAAYRSKSCVTDGRGEFLVELDPASLPVGGAVSVTVRAGDNEQTFTLNGNAAPLNGLAVEFSGGGAFTTPGAQGYQSVLKMTVKMYVNGVEDPTWTPNGSVTWTVTSAISGLSTGAEGVWKRAANARNGLMWVSSDSDSVDGTTNWGIDEIKGTPPTGATAYLADVVGSRRITVTAADSSGSSGGQTFTFGAGPLSVFSKTGTGYMLWSSNGTTDNTRADSGSFQYPTNTFPAVAFCGGGVNNDVTVTGSATPSDAGFDPNSGGWEPRDFLGFPDAYLYAGSYAANSRMPTARQLLAVAAYWPYSNTSGDAAGRKGAALAAGWPNVFWTGEVCFYNPSFRAWLVYLDIGYVVSSPVDLSGSAIPACVQ
jgi:hypothetical protein